MTEPAFPIESRFLHALRTGALPAPRHQHALADAGLTGAELAELFESQVLSRQLDLHARRLHARKEGFYTIGSSGHEGNAAIAKALRVTDPAFLHYRDAAFFIQRSKQLPGSTPIYDLLLSFVASADDPISGGRHKVLGSKALNIPPQTSTIASHLPKAVGAAYSMGLWRRLRKNSPLPLRKPHPDFPLPLREGARGRGKPKPAQIPPLPNPPPQGGRENIVEAVRGQGEWPDDSVVLCSFGDGSFNHSTAQGALNTAAWTAHQGVPLPLLFVCEDNGLSISVPTPHDWIETAMHGRPAINYLSCDGLDLLDTYKAAREVERIARQRRQPVFLHLRCVRLMGHAGSDAEQGYLSAAQIEAMEAQDPLLYSAGLLVDHGVLSAAEILDLYEGIGARVRHVAEEAIRRPKLHTAAEVMASIVPPKRPSRTIAVPDEPVLSQPAPMARLLNHALDRLMARCPHLILAGEDIGKKGGVYGVTLRLQAKYGAHRVIDTLLDEQSILGLSIGLAHNGFVPMPEIQFLAYLHNAEDQLRGEASTLSFFSKGQFTNPMVVRIAGLGYQKGFGGHFHNDNALAVLRDIPGLLVACPANGADAVGLLQEAVRLADEEQRMVVFLEPIALYHCRDLHALDDGLWCCTDPGPAHRIAPGELGIGGEGADLAIVTYGNSVYLSRQAAPELERRNIALRIVDLRWLTGIDHERVHAAVKDCARVLIVDECRRSGSPSEELMVELCARGWDATRLRRLTAEDSFIPLGVAATSTLPSKERIVAEAVALAGAKKRRLRAS